MKEFFNIRTTPLAEEHGAGEQGTPSLVAKYKSCTPGQGTDGSTNVSRQPARKGDKLNAKDEPNKPSVSEATTTTVVRDKSGKMVSWRSESDWRKKTNKNPRGVVTHASDVARRTTKKMGTNEEAQIDELNKSTLASYAKKAVKELPKHQANATIKHTGPIANAHAGKHPKTGESPVQYDDRKVKNRGAGITRAVDKLTKEGVEEATDMAALRNKISRHTELAVAANKAGDHDAVKKHQATINKYKNKMAKAVRSEETELSQDACKVCGQTPCNCTFISEQQKHKVAVTVSEPDHPAVTMRKVTKQKFVKLTAGSKEEAVKKAQAFYKKQGYKVHSAEYHSAMNEGENKQVKDGDPCWKGYQMVGTKDKGGKKVPNCVPVKEDIKTSVKALRDMIEEASYKVDVEGLPTMYVTSTSPTEVKTNLRKILKKADMIKSVDRIPDVEVKKAFRLKAMGKEDEGQQ